MNILRSFGTLRLSSVMFDMAVCWKIIYRQYGYGYTRRTQVYTLLIILVVVSSWHVFRTHGPIIENFDFIYRDQQPIRTVNSTKGIPWLSCPQLPRATSRPQHDHIIDLVRDVTKLFDSHNIRYAMVSGTLIGSYMFHDVIPWDDDVDIWINLADLPQLKRLFADKDIRRIFDLHTWTDLWIDNHEYDLDTLRAFPPNAKESLFYRLHPSDHRTDVSTLYHRFKIYRQDATRAGSRGWNWPFIEAVFYTENVTHVWNYEPEYRVTLSRHQFYPLIKRPLSYIWVNAPRDSGEFLHQRYGTSSFSCVQQSYRHVMEKWRWFWQHRGTVDCNVVRDFYPTVKSVISKRGLSVEQLVFNGSVLQTVYITGAEDTEYGPRPIANPADT